ncbi:acyl-CoA dehydrogenase [Sinomicrobium pectinilyticum]|uniref:Acyl-CoA dehydrogenase n=1 Tax=Sinomicrobium pectinilyticum TaxID=1084421 RepID=A0A3N0DP12_SINP1|nr:acyl-CoA dehydrogenase [Sinomicrobium pectinilyticum]
MAQGRQLAGFALFEPGAGSNPMAITGKAVVTDDGYFLNAEKMWIGSAGWSSLIITFAKLADSNSSERGITCFAVPRNKPGVHIGKELLTMGMRGMVQNRINFDVVKLEKRYPIGEEEKGMDIANDAMMLARITAGATLLGAMEKCIQLMYRYSSRREVATGSLLKNPVTRQSLSSSMMEAALMESLVNYIASTADTDIRNIPAELCVVSKVGGSEFLWKAVDADMQCAGGRGYLQNNYISQLIRDARVVRIFEGPSEVLITYMGTKHIRAVDKDQLYELISVRLRQPELSGELENVYQKSRELLKRNIEDTSLIAFRNGNILTWVLLLAVYAGTMSNPDPEVISYAKQQIRIFTAQLDNFNPTSGNYDIDTISKYVRKINDDIGNLEILTPDEEYDMDDYFKK